MVRKFIYFPAYICTIRVCWTIASCYYTFVICSYIIAILFVSLFHLLIGIGLSWRKLFYYASVNRAHIIFRWELKIMGFYSFCKEELWLCCVCYALHSNNVVEICNWFLFQPKWVWSINTLLSWNITWQGFQFIYLLKIYFYYFLLFFHRSTLKNHQRYTKGWRILLCTINVRSGDRL